MSSTTRTSARLTVAQLATTFDAYAARQDAVNEALTANMVALTQAVQGLATVVAALPQAQPAQPALPQAYVSGEVVTPAPVAVSAPRKRKAVTAKTTTPATPKAPKAPKPELTPEQQAAKNAEREASAQAWREAKAARQAINRPLAEWLRANGLPSGGEVWTAVRKGGVLDLAQLAQIAGKPAPVTPRELSEFLTPAQLAALSAPETATTASTATTAPAAPAKRVRKPKAAPVAVQTPVETSVETTVHPAQDAPVVELSELTMLALRNAQDGVSGDDAQAQRLRQLNALQAAGFTLAEADAAIAAS